MRFFSWLLVALLALSFSSHAAAQAAGEEEEARQAFIQGSEAANEGRWADSLQYFQQAYMLSGVPTALYNAAMALRALGRHREARDAFQRILDEHGDSPAAEQSLEKRAEEAARVAMLILAGLDADADYSIRLDGRPVDVDRGITIELETDPGRRGLVAEREGYEPFTWEGDLSDGERRTIAVEMAEIEVESTSVLKSPVFWIVVGAVLVGAGVGVGIFLQNNAQLEPTFADNALEL